MSEKGFQKKRCMYMFKEANKKEVAKDEVSHVVKNKKKKEVYLNTKQIYIHNMYMHVLNCTI